MATPTIIAPLGRPALTVVIGEPTGGTGGLEASPPAGSDGGPEGGETSGIGGGGGGGGVGGPPGGVTSGAGGSGAAGGGVGSSGPETDPPAESPPGAGAAGGSGLLRPGVLRSPDKPAPLEDDSVGEASGEIIGVPPLLLSAGGVLPSDGEPVGS